MRCGVIDLGSSTFHALVADVDAHGVRRIVFERGAVLRLGEHAENALGISEHVRQRAVHTIHNLLERTQQRASQRVQVIATGALRDTVSGQRFIAEASARLGIAIDTLDEQAEARLTWLGVSSELAGSHGRLAVLDLGGGSFEVACGATHAIYTSSMPIGVLRLRQMATPAIRDHVEQLAAQAIHELVAYRPETLAVSSGTARSLLRVARKLGMVTKEQRHIASGVFLKLARKIPQLSAATLLDLGVSQARLDTIGVGAAMYATILARLARPVVYVAQSALREGVLVERARTSRESERVLPIAAAL